MTYRVSDYAAVRRLRVPAIRRGVTRLEVLPPPGQPSVAHHTTRRCDLLNRALRFSGGGWVGVGLAWMVYLALLLASGGPLVVDPLSQIGGLLALMGGGALTRGLIWGCRELLWWQVLERLEQEFDRRRKPRLAAEPSPRSHDRRPRLEAPLQPEGERWSEPPARAVSRPA